MKIRLLGKVDKKAKIFIALMAILSTLILLFQNFTTVPARYDYVVSPNGIGETCSYNAPCSLETARASVRVSKGTMIKDIRIILRGGLYQLSEPIVLGPSDSGNNGFFINYVGAANETPILSGGAPVRGWTLDDQEKNIYSVPVDANFNVRQLYVNGTRVERARILGEELQYKMGVADPALGASLKVNIPNMSSWKDIQDLELVSRVKWRLMRCPVESIRSYEDGFTFKRLESSPELSSVIPTSLLEGDFDGDKNSDLLSVYEINGEKIVEVAMASGSGFAKSMRWFKMTAPGAQFQVGDFNGDGKSDLLIYYFDSLSVWHNDVALSNGSGFDVQTNWLSTNGRGTKYYIGDFNGDKKSDILMAYRDNSGIWRNAVAISLGTSFQPKGSWLDNQGQGATYYLGDYNGDSLTDILFAWKDRSNVWHNSVALSKGASFAFSIDWMPNVGIGARYLLGDFNSDGKTDIAFSYFHQKTIWKNVVALSAGNSFRFVGEWLEGITMNFDNLPLKSSSRTSVDLILVKNESSGVSYAKVLSDGGSFIPEIPKGTSEIYADAECWKSANAFVDKPWLNIINSKLSWIENGHAFIKPGQFYHSRSEGVLYYSPRENEDINNAMIIAPRLESLISGQDFQNIRFISLTFAYSGWTEPSALGFVETQAGYHRHVSPRILHQIPGAIQLINVRDINFFRNKFLHLGGAGIHVAGHFDIPGNYNGSQNINITENSFSDISAGALILGGVQDPKQDSVERRSQNYVVQNNYITKTAVEYEASPAIVLGYVANALIRFNEIDTTSYTGISMGWGWGTASETYMSNNRIERNWIHHTMQRLFDGAAIYTLGKQTGSTIRGNLIEQVGASNCAPYTTDKFLGIVGIYFDNGSEGFLAENNGILKSCGYTLLLQNRWDLPPINLGRHLNNFNITIRGAYSDYDRVWCDGGANSSLACNYTDKNVVTETIKVIRDANDIPTIRDNAGILATVRAAVKNIPSGSLYPSNFE